MIKLEKNKPDDQNDDSDKLIKKYVGLLNNLTVNHKSDQLLQSIQEGIQDVDIVDSIIEPSLTFYISNSIYHLIYFKDKYTLYLKNEKSKDSSAGLIILNQLTNYYVGIPDSENDELKFYSVQEVKNAKFGICIGIIKEYVNIVDIPQVINTCKTILELNQNL